MPEAELRIRLTGGEVLETRYQRAATAWSVRRVLVEQMSHSEMVQCVKGEIPARDIEGIDFICRFSEERS